MATQTAALRFFPSKTALALPDNIPAMIKPAAARALAMTMPEASEAPHFEKSSFRVAKKIFATMGEGGDPHMVVKLTPDQQSMMGEVRPDVFSALPGRWGEQGWTRIAFEACDAETLHHALGMSWRNVAPKRLLTLLTE